MSCFWPGRENHLGQPLCTLSIRSGMTCSSDWLKYNSRRYLQCHQTGTQLCTRFCGWCHEDHDHFLFIVSLYTHDIPNHRELCMDMLLRLFPEKNRQELNEHNRIWDSQRFTQAQLRAVTQQCQRDQEELWVKALVTIQEAKHAHQQKLEVYRDRQHQQDICLKLREKLQQWRAQQEEVAKLEAAIAAREHQQKEARLKRGQEKEAAFRSQQTKEVRMFHLKEQKRREELQQRDELRLAKLRSLMEEQARRDKQRVQFRADMLEQRRMQRDAQEAERQREEKAREERLEALRNKVAVVAEADPERLMAETKAWRNQLSAKETELPRPLYNINTYTDTQIVSDPRMRVEQALREAGVQHSQYAREVLSIVKPVKPPRRDTKSLLQF
uniref:Coiled-coil domain-containing protein 148 n=1 Tax=Gouania willdenowi TaxID=441366 RepID=A0A8C5I2D2_GOUWI